MTSADWNAGWIKCFGMMLDGRCRKTAIPRYGEDDSVLIIMNSFDGEVDFKLPHTTAGPQWSLLLDTNNPDGGSGATFDFGSVYKVPGRSFLAFVAGPIK
jgi:glycogen operon protein